MPPSSRRGPHGSLGYFSRGQLDLTNITNARLGAKMILKVSRTVRVPEYASTTSLVDLRDDE